MHQKLSSGSDDERREPQLIHVADPMCSWCYAFEPELRLVLDEIDLPIRLVMGGLFVGKQALPLDDALRTYLRTTWARVAELSGQPVAFELLDLPTWTYDTEPACRAVVAARTIDAPLTLALFERLQGAFYAESADLTDPDVLIRIAELAGFDRQSFMAAFHDDATRALVDADFAEARQLGAAGFPTLVFDTGTERVTVAAGYVQAQQVMRTINVFRT